MALRSRESLPDFRLLAQALRYRRTQPEIAKANAKNARRSAGDDEETSRPGRVAAPAAPATRSGEEELLSAAAPSRSSSVRSRPRTAAPTAPPADTAASTTDSQDQSAEGASPSGEAAVVTTTGASESQAPARAEPAAEQPGGDIPAAQQS